LGIEEEFFMPRCGALFDENAGSARASADTCAAILLK
jgi:hypothetical protein